MKLPSKILKLFLIWRITLFVPVILSGLILNYGSSFPFFDITYYQQLPIFLNHPVLTVWSNFDGVHYINIVVNGYTTEARFFPFLPLLILIFSLGNMNFLFTYFISLIIPSAALLISLVLFYKLLKLDYDDKISQNSIIYMLFFPTSFFFAAVYTESIFLLFSIACLYLARKKQWLFISTLTMFLVSTRFVGIFIIPALIYEYCIQNKSLKFKNYLKILELTIVPLAGLVAYSIFNYIKWGSLLHFLTAHSELNNGRSSTSLVLPFQTMYRYSKILTTIPVTQFEWWIAILEISSFIVGTILLFISWRKKVRTSYLIFAVGAFMLPAFSGTFSGLPRYLVIAFPVFIALSLIKNKYIKVCYFVVSVPLLFLLLMFFSKGYYIS